jgi:hypothetical protein
VALFVDSHCVCVTQVVAPVIREDGVTAQSCRATIVRPAPCCMPGQSTMCLPPSPILCDEKALQAQRTLLARCAV